MFEYKVSALEKDTKKRKELCAHVNLDMANEFYWDAMESVRYTDVRIDSREVGGWEPFKGE